MGSGCIGRPSNRLEDGVCTRGPLAGSLLRRDLGLCHRRHWGVTNASGLKRIWDLILWGSIGGDGVFVASCLGCLYVVDVRGSRSARDRPKGSCY